MCSWSVPPISLLCASLTLIVRRSSLILHIGCWSARALLTNLLLKWWPGITAFTLMFGALVCSCSKCTTDPCLCAPSLQSQSLDIITTKLQVYDMIFPRLTTIALHLQLHQETRARHATQGSFTTETIPFPYFPPSKDAMLL